MLVEIKKNTSRIRLPDWGISFRHRDQSTISRHLVSMITPTVRVFVDKDNHLLALMSTPDEEISAYRISSQRMISLQTALRTIGFTGDSRAVVVGTQRDNMIVFDLSEYCDGGTNKP